MASIFTFDPSPPRVSSPWSTPRTSTPKPTVRSSPLIGEGTSIGNIETNGPGGDDSDVVVTSLEAEPQDGPTEYKLHLLCRPRRNFTCATTSSQVPGSYRQSPSNVKKAVNINGKGSPGSQPAILPSVSRQNRLEQLTTQLLWRLQQSSSYHSTTYKPNQNQLKELLEPGKSVSPMSILPGLEDSKGALYEIGVADDGTFVGLATDELEESLQNLRIMAASLGCSVSVLRQVAVGECRWEEYDAENKKSYEKASPLWVAEAYVRPSSSNEENGDLSKKHHFDNGNEPQPSSNTDQLRITLTGATMSGKSSLLGTLTTSTLDNGRGKSRLNLLKHQHEIASGMTSSVTHELLGYCESDESTQIVNFASGNVSSWVDIHSSCENGRLIFFSDSAGHPRYRRTTVRGLIGWSPHWTMLCIPADNLEDTSGRLGSTPPPHEALGLPATDLDLSQDNLELCLKLELPLIVVITKVDLASRLGLRSYLNKVFSALKRAGRQPFIVADFKKQPLTEADMQEMTSVELSSVKKQFEGLHSDPCSQVPIVLTSSVRGTGVMLLHGILRELPIPGPRKSSSLSHDGCTVMFDIEDTFTVRRQSDTDQPTLILSGVVRYGRFNIGDELLIGPFFVDAAIPTGKSLAQSLGHSPPQLSAFRTVSGTSPLSNLANKSTNVTREWYKVRISSLRHLRLPARSLLADQVGTIAIVPSTSVDEGVLEDVRKGMILTDGTPQAQRSFVAEFARKDVDSLSIGSSVVVYFNSVRASAKVVAGAIASGGAIEQSLSPSDDESFPFGFEDDSGEGQSKSNIKDDGEKLMVTFQFIASREYVELASRVLVMPGGGAGLYIAGTRGEKGVAGLSGFVGVVVEP